MTLDLGAIGRQLAELATTVAGRRANEQDVLRRALDLVAQATDPGEIAAKVEGSRTAWRCALPLEPLATHPAEPSLPGEWSVLASDGSSAEPDRHGVALCYLINVGLVALRYGEHPSASLRSEPYLGFRDDDLYVAAGEQQVLVSGPVLAMVRQALESQQLAALAAERPEGVPTLALQDGTFMLGALEGAGLEQWLQATLLPRLLAQYDRLRICGTPLAAYTSRPRHAEVTNALRLWACPERFPDCQHGCDYRDGSPPGGALLCRTLANLPDRVLFQSLLKAGERSAICRSQWAVSLRYFGVHRLHFFYVHAGPEVARVEVPEWVANDAHLLNLVHATVVDQCRRGRGYPTALLEAHEQAVLRGSDRRQFEQMLETALARAGLPASTSEKERGKRLRAL